jgi:deoxyribonuclease V
VSAQAAGRWPRSAAGLVVEQHALAVERPPSWEFAAGSPSAGASSASERAAPRPGRVGDPAWAAASLGDADAVVTGTAGAPYEPGLLALREGALLEEAATER